MLTTFDYLIDYPVTGRMITHQEPPDERAVWCLLYGDNEHSLISVHSTEAKAREALQKRGQHSCFVEEYEIDE